MQWEVKPVLQTFRTQYDGDIVTINIGDDIIHSTGGHPFWVIDGVDLEYRPLCDCLPDCDQKTTPNGRWVYARDLRIDDVVRSRSFGTQKISALELSLTETLVYNFLVDDLHNYCVSKNEILVHNTNAPQQNIREKPPQRTGAGRSDPHGDAGRSWAKAERQIQEIDEQIKHLEKSQEKGRSKEIKKLKATKQNIVKATRGAMKGETHWRR